LFKVSAIHLECCYGKIQGRTDLKVGAEGIGGIEGIGGARGNFIGCCRFCFLQMYDYIAYVQTVQIVQIVIACEFDRKLTVWKALEEMYHDITAY